MSELLGDTDTVTGRRVPASRVDRGPRSSFPQLPGQPRTAGGWLRSAALAPSCWFVRIHQRLVLMKAASAKLHPLGPAVQQPPTVGCSPVILSDAATPAQSGARNVRSSSGKIFRGAEQRMRFTSSVFCDTRRSTDFAVVAKCS
jgi:hypothetical protein